MSQSCCYLIAGTWLEGTCNLAMTVTMKGFKFFVSSTQPHLLPPSSTAPGPVAFPESSHRSLQAVTTSRPTLFR